MKSKSQPMKKNAASIPKLRFPDFQDAPEWDSSTIGNIGRFYYGKSAPKWSLAEDAPTPCVRYGELYTKFGAIVKETYSRTTIEPSKLRFSKGGEILVPRVGEKPEDFGKCCSYLPLKGVAIGEMISVFETKENSLFYTYYFRRLYKEFAKVVEGQNVKNLYYAELEPLAICCPSKPEQQRIADCLSSLDEWIEAEAKQLDALKDHKKGLMQQLFPAEGETTPKLRFPEFQDAPEWEEKKLGNIFNLQDGFAFKSTDFVKKGDNRTQVVRISDINNQNKNEDKVYIPDAFLETINADRYKIMAGDMLLSLTGAAGFNFYLWNDQAAVINQRTAKITPKREKDRHLIRLLEPLAYRKINERGEGQNNNLSRDFLSNVVLLVPSPAEQKEIADCLTSIDDWIAAQSDRIDALKEFKSGLMQQLFPSGKEVNA